MLKLEAKDFLNEGVSLPIIDVRSPQEFAEGHIPSALNMPIFDNAERAVVGTLYKQKGKQEAVIKGLEFVGPKMAEFATQALALADNGRVLVHCWRGGMRSESMAWLFEKVGLDVRILIGGYKAYRRYCVEQMKSYSNIVVLKGFTGSGKTEMLYELRKQGQQMVDLEGLANHRGSAFGGIGQGIQPTTQQFQNELFHVLSCLDPHKHVWVEGESKPIGRIYIPDVFWEMMQEALVVEVDVPFDCRVDRLVNDYAQLDPDAMLAAIAQLEKRLGNQRMNEVAQAFQQKDYRATAAMLLTYYDKGYSHSSKVYSSTVLKVELSGGDIEQNVQVILDSL